MKPLYRTYALVNRLRAAWQALTTRHPFIYVEVRPEVALMLTAHDPNPSISDGGVVRMNMGGLDLFLMVMPHEEGPPDRSDGPGWSHPGGGGQVVSGPWGVRPPSDAGVSSTGSGSGSVKVGD